MWLAFECNNLANEVIERGFQKSGCTKETV
jgi:hypothetical protein